MTPKVDCRYTDSDGNEWALQISLSGDREQDLKALEQLFLAARFTIIPIPERGN